ncbi:MAG: hypothetical protein QOK43_834 [Acidimicrobiaceae bacterium]|nr:hypothetical protein [Acidimicrobiaceae bacterium]
MKGFLATTIAALLVFGLVAVALDHRPRTVRKVPTDETRLRLGQTEVRGTATALRAEPANTAPVPLPLTLNVPQRGAGGATIANALVGNKRSTIVWDGGTPLVLRAAGAGAGALDVSGSKVEVDGAGIRWSLDGPTHAFAPGRYSVLSPVAVGVSGLATSRPSVDFTADETTVMSTHGGAFLALPGGPLTIEGPGVVHIEGRVGVRTPTDERASHVDGVQLSGGYRVTVRPAAGGLGVLGLFEPEAG